MMLGTLRPCKTA